MKKVKMTLLLCVLAVVLAFTGCSKHDTEKADEQLKSREKLSLTEIEALAAERVFNVHWYTEEGEFSAGTAFVTDSEKHEQKLLVTAFHFLWPEGAQTFSGEELPEFVHGGEIYYAYNELSTKAFLKNCLIIEDADAVPVVDKDVAAFTIQGGDDLKTLPLATTMPKAGDKIYLLASLWDSDVINENCVYPGKVENVDGGVLYYTLDGKPGTTGASGGPVINEYGEVVAMHMASNFLYFVGHMPSSFGKQIEAATISDITYPEMTASEEAEQEEGIAGMEEHTYDEKVSTMFYDIQINEVTYTDTLAGQASEEGCQYMVVDVSLWAAEGLNEPVDMYYYDFVAEWTDGYCEPLETGLSEDQLPDEYTITSEETRGKLVFLVPMDEETIVFSFIDYYYTEESEEPQYGTYYVVYLPAEDWTR